MKHRALACLLITIALLPPSLSAHPLDDVYRKHSNFAENAPPGVLLRRMSLQIRGVIPTAEEVRAFESANPDTRNELFAARFLRDADYAHYWSGVLGSMLRARSDQRDAPYDAYQAWLAKSLHENRSYRQMVRDLITAKGSVDQNAAGLFYLRDNADPLEAAEYVSRVFYGRRLSCARCHDHPTDPNYKRRDFYGLASFFSQTFVRKNKLDEIPWNRREDLPVDARKKYEDEMRRLRAQMNWDKLSDAQRKKLREQNELPFAQIDVLPELGLRFPHTDDSPGGDLVKPVYPDGKPAIIEAGADRREVLAKWLTAKTNDRFRKVIINRIWTRLMGWSFFTPLDDWGPETKIRSPEILDHLDAVFVEKDYRIKDLILYIVTSDAYRRRSPAPGESVNGDESALASFPPSRMDYAQLFNSMLRGTNNASVPHVWERSATTSLDLTGQGALKQAVKDNKAGFTNACEVPKPVHSSTFLSIFGAGRREDVDDDEIRPDIDQVLALMNGQLTSRIWREYGDPNKNSFILQEFERTKRMDDLFDTIYVSLLSRHPSEKEKAGLQRVFSSRFEAQGGFQRDQVQDLVWSILQSREFIHIY